MALSTYTELRDTVSSWLEKPEIDQEIPTFIRLAESRIDRELRHWRQVARTSISLAGQYNSVLPTDFIQPIRLQILTGSTGEVAPISNAAMLVLRGERNDRVGTPTNYALTAGQIEVYPTPDATYSASLVYYGRVPALSTVNTTNWLLTEAPDVYLYGTLLHSAPYLGDDQRAMIWEGLFATSLAKLSLSSESATYGGSGLRMKTKR